MAVLCHRSLIGFRSGITAACCGPDKCLLERTLKLLPGHTIFMFFTLRAKPSATALAGFKSVQL